MSQPNDRKRKMDALISGDSPKSHRSHEGSCSQAKNACIESGDSQSALANSHEFVAVLRDLQDEDSPAVVHKQVCEMGDRWSYKVPLPLSSFPVKNIKTGNKFYDQILPNFPDIGYKPLQVLCKGRSGTILLAQDVRQGLTLQEKECVPVAIKLNSGKKKKGSSSAQTSSQSVTVDIRDDDEILIHQRLQHQNIVAFHRSISYQGRTGMVLEFCECGNLEELLRTRDGKFVHENVARRYLHQLHSAIEYLHLAGVAHRDIHPTNILVSNDNTLKLCDFNQAVNFSPGDDLLQGVVGSTGYQAPEMLLESPYSPRQVDLYALGCVLYYTVSGRLPYGRLKSPEEVKAMKPLEFPKANVLVLTLAVKELLSGMLAYMPSARFTLNRVRNSEWFQTSSEKVQIGSFHIVRQPQKVAEGDRERDVKAEFDI